jgi:membrane-bound ClpP family serine protease
MVLNLSVIIASIILLAGIILGLIDFNMNLKALHTALGITFIVIIVLGLRTHFLRLLIIPKDPVSWGHVLIFSWILFLSVSALIRWNRKKKETKNNH